MMRNTGRRAVSGVLALFVLSAGSVAVSAPQNVLATTRVQSLVSQRNVTALRDLGPPVIAVLVQLYRTSGEAQRAAIAETFYTLGWKSSEAKQVLMQDVHTKNPELRLQVQWALGRVSADPDVVEVLLNNMMNDANPLFRDKAACALAYDQVHLSERQKVRLFEGLIQGLSDNKTDVRSIAILALNIQTGQTKGFDPNGAPPKREAAIREWRKWLDDYRSRW
jgi:hypothetical protein